MFKLRLKMHGVKEVRRQLAVAPSKIRETAHNSIQRDVDAMKDEAQQIVPVRTGHLRDSIFTKEMGAMSFIIGADAEYAGFVEYGTSRMMARPFLRPAMQMYESIIMHHLRRRLADTFRMM